MSAKGSTETATEQTDLVNAHGQVPAYNGPTDITEEEEEQQVQDALYADMMAAQAPDASLDDVLRTMRGRSERLGDIPPIRASQFVHLAFRMPNEHTRDLEPFSFEGRRHMYRLYDTPINRVLLCCARQTEKSTLLGNKALTYSCLIPGYKTLYVSPSATQTKTFSADRLREPLDTSNILRAYTNPRMSMNIFEKQFINYSKITLRYAFLSADRARGIAANQLLLDEIQDLLSDNIPVIEQCTSHSPDNLKRFTYAGTPKSLDNTIEDYRSHHSTQGEWVVPCDSCGSKAIGGAGRYWNILGEKNIGLQSLICDRCGKQIFPQHEDAKWANQVAYHPKRVPFESYRVPQLMVPWKPWEEILLDYRRYPRNQFFNEVLGLSFDSGMRPLSLTQIRESCLSEVNFSEEHQFRYKELGLAQPVFAGIDWGSGDNAYTLLLLGTYVNNRLRIFYAKRFAGTEAEPVTQMRVLISILRSYNVALIGCDHGFGFSQNDELLRTFGPERVQRFQYFARTKVKCAWDSSLRRFKVHRTEVMSDIFNAIKRKQIDFPSVECFEDPFAQDMCNIYSEYNEKLRMVQYDHNNGRPDDTFHALVYLVLISMIKVRRPDIITPRREDPTRGPIYGSESSDPIDQG